MSNKELNLAQLITYMNEDCPHDVSPDGEDNWRLLKKRGWSHYHHITGQYAEDNVGVTMFVSPQGKEMRSWDLPIITKRVIPNHTPPKKRFSCSLCWQELT